MNKIRSTIALSRDFDYLAASTSILCFKIERLGASSESEDSDINSALDRGGRRQIRGWRVKNRGTCLKSSSMVADMVHAATTVVVYSILLLFVINLINTLVTIKNFFKNLLVRSYYHHHQN